MTLIFEIAIGIVLGVILLGVLFAALEAGFSFLGKLWEAVEEIAEWILHLGGRGFGFIWRHFVAERKVNPDSEQ
jgi:hypothetical protein